MRKALTWMMVGGLGLMLGCALHSNRGAAGTGAGSGGSAGSAATGGVGGVGGSGGVGGAGSGGVGGAGSGGVGGAGSGGVGGSAGSGGVGGQVECPGLTPVEGTPCSGVGQCVMESSGLPGCRTIWECFESRWVKVFDGGCVGPSIDLCPLTPEAAEGQVCLGFPCVYPGSVICDCEQPCSGVQPDPELLRTVCFPANAAVCVVPKEPGQACSPIGRACAPACCGTRWDCTAQGWSAGEVFCPP